MQNSPEGIFIQLQTTLSELFELAPNTITLESRLYQDLDLDSIDAVDLIVHLQTMTKRKFNPEEFKAVRTVNDVVQVIHTELSK